MTDFAIKVENLSKCYRIGLKKKSPDTIMEAMASWFKSPLTNFRSLRQLSQFSNNEYGSADIIWALRDVSFEVQPGEVVGVFGRNGAGKSTLLKIISHITDPSNGRVILNGRVSSLLEVGTGFHGDLTGRENIYLNGTILGMTKREIDRKLDEIIDFSGVEKFIDTPVKRYSSGMKVRLAFSVAAHLEPEVLLVDEVLAVGDATFQKKCIGKMGEEAQAGRTILFVSHNMEAIRGLCQRGIWISDGMIQTDGDAGEVVQTYLDSLTEKEFSCDNREYGLFIQKVVLKNDKGEETRQFFPGEDLVVEIWFNAPNRVEKPYFLLIVQGINGNCFTANMLLDGHRPAALEGEGVISCRFNSIPLLPQQYTLRMEIRAKDGKEPILAARDVDSFSVVANLEEYGYKGEFQSLATRSTPVVVPYEWKLPDGSKASVALNKNPKAQ
jgi:lipopolysaccharide transport system ATP-binding protein